MKQSPITYNYPLRVSGNPLREMSNLGDELLDGLNEWRNVQDIVRLTFKGLSDVVKKQGIAIDEIQEQLNSKVNTSDIPKYVQSPGDTQISVENQDYINRVSRTDLNLLKQEIEEVKLGTIGHARASSQLSARAVDSEIQNLQFSMDNTIREISRIQHDMLTQQDLNLMFQKVERKFGSSDMEDFLQGKANKESVANALHRKANKGDVEAALDEKAERSEVEDLLKLVDTKADNSKIELLFRDLSSKLSHHDPGQSSSIKAFKQEVDQRFLDQYSDIEKYISMLREDIEKVSTSLSNSLARKADTREVDRLSLILSNKADNENVTNVLAGLKVDMNEQITHSTGKQPLSEFLAIQDEVKEIQTARRKDLSYIEQIQVELTDLKSQKSEKFELTELKLAFERFQNETIAAGATKDFARKLSELRNEVRTALSQCQEDAIVLVKDKVDKKDLLSVLTERSDPSARGRDENYERFKKQVEQHMDRMEQHIQLHETSIENLSRGLDQKSKSMNDIKSIQNFKQDLEELTYSVTETQEDLRTKLNIEDFTWAIKEQTGITGQLMAENWVGRWIWKSGKVSPQGTIPWEIESTNTCPDNFVWDTDRTHIMTIAPGLYEIHYAFFVRSEPEVSCTVNGEFVVSGDSTSSNKTYGRHSAGNCIGYTVMEVLSLPARARVSLSYSGEEEVSGFLFLKKL